MLASQRPLSLLLLLALTACPGRAAHRPGEPVRPAAPVQLTLVGTNDLHGWVQSHPRALPDGTALNAGGLEVFAGYLEVLRARNPGGVVLVDAGDLFQGTLVANLSEGAVVIDAYNALGYDAAAIGNHEFDYGPVGPRSAAIRPEDDALGALAACAERARFPLLARNVHLADGSRPPFLESSTIVERHGVKVGILGLLTPMTPQVTNPVNVQRLRFEDMASEARSGAAELRAQGAEVLVALVHAGGRCSDLSDPASLASCDRRGEIFGLLEALPAGLFDAVVAGHTHASVGHLVNGMPVIESGSYGKQFGLIELTIDPATRRPVPGQTRIRSSIPVCARIIEQTGGCNAKLWQPGMTLAPATFEGVAITPSATIEALLAPFLGRVTERQRQSLKVPLPATLTREYRHESPLGNALADALRAMEGADVALLNSGGLRADLPAGELTYGALYEVFPFDNAIATLRLTGAEIVALFESLLSSTHGAPQSSGLRFVAERCGRRTKITRITLADGRPLKPEAVYELTTSDFLALGGDGVGEVLDRVPAERKDFGHERDLGMRDALAEWLERRGGTFEAGVDGRMRVVDSSREGCEPVGDAHHQ